MTKHIVSSNTIPVEWFDKFCTDDDAVKLFHVERNNLLDERETLREEILEKETERLREQAYFAQELIDELESCLESCTKLKDFKAAFARIVENSYFER